MRMSNEFGLTLRAAPGKTEAEGHHMLLRAAFVRQLGQGIFSYLPLGLRSIRKIENVIRQEMDAVGGLEMLMPVVHPAEIWKATERYYTVGPEMARFKDRRGRDLVLAMTHEEVVADLCKSEINSYRDLPRLVYHIQTKFRDDPRPRAGLIRVREFTMKDAYSLDIDEAGLDAQYRVQYQAYFNVFNRCGLPVIAVGSDVGMMGGSLAHEFMYLTPIGEDTLVLCDNCGYSANRQVASFVKPEPPHDTPLPLERVATPGTATIDSLAAFLHVPASRTAKAMFMATDRERHDGSFVVEPIVAIIRGDHELNETKLANAIEATDLRPMTEEEIAKIGAVPGYGSPIGVTGATVVVDDLVATSPNLVAGANEEGYHFLTPTTGVTTPRTSSPTSSPRATATRVSSADRRCGPHAASRPATSSSEAPAIRGRSVRHSWVLTGSSTRSSWAATASGSTGFSRARPRSTMTPATASADHHRARARSPVPPRRRRLPGRRDRRPALRGTPGARGRGSLRRQGRAAGSPVRRRRPDRAAATGNGGRKSLARGGVEVKRRDSETAEVLSAEDVSERLTGEIRNMFEETAAKVVPVVMPEPAS